MAQDRPAALITGASSGIGRAAAVAFAGAGFDVVINYSRSEEAARETAAQARGAGTLVFACDVRDDAGVRAMLEAAKNEFGRLDALVNNAGTTTNVNPGDFESMTAEEWDRVFAVNVRGVFQVTRAAVPMLKAARGSVLRRSGIQQESFHSGRIL
jgi:3-oxoacyl-[acyl-carrier protein] reductase